MITTVGELKAALEEFDENSKLEALLLTRGGPAEWLWLTSVRANVFHDIEGATTVVSLDTTRRDQHGSQGE